MDDKKWVYESVTNLVLGELIREEKYRIKYLAPTGNKYYISKALAYIKD